MAVFKDVESMDPHEAFKLARERSRAIHHAFKVFKDETEALKAACVILHECNEQLVERYLDIESIAPRFVKTENGKEFRWDCPTDLAKAMREKLEQ